MCNQKWQNAHKNDCKSRKDGPDIRIYEIIALEHMGELRTLASA
jgi:hypothetical protein